MLITADGTIVLARRTGLGLAIEFTELTGMTIGDGNSGRTGLRDERAISEV